MNEVLGSDQVYEPAFYDELINVIERAVRLDEWEDRGGTATINVLGRVLIVRANERTHLELEKFFALLKEQDLKALTSAGVSKQLLRTR